MKQNLYFLSILVLWTGQWYASAQSRKSDREKSAILWSIDREQQRWDDLALSIWKHPEVGYQEERTSALLQEILRKEGFSVAVNVAAIPTAFVAEFGSGSPVVGILAEFDALPGMSQDAVPFRSAAERNGPGHACGHHLFGAGSVAAAVNIKHWMEENNIKGTLKVFGTPAEEGGSGKVYMVREGLFKGVDAVFHWHPDDENTASARTSLANKSAKFRFHGIAAHAALAPEMGRSALDGVEAMNFMVNLMREHVPSDARIHYVITEGGQAPNVVPEFAEVFYYVRHQNRQVLNDIWTRLERCAEAAATGTGTRMDREIIHGNYDVLPNVTLSELVDRNLRKVGGVIYNEDERAFALKLQETEGMKKIDVRDAENIRPFNKEEAGFGSTDVGDVSYAAPTAGLNIACWVPGTSAHTWRAVAAGGMSIGSKGMMVAAKTLALSMMDIFSNPALAAKASTELKERRGSDFSYEALLGDRKPPLDYRR